MGANLCFFAMMNGFLCLPLSLAIIIFQTNPFFTALFGRIINDETIYPFELIGMVLSFSGVCLLGLHSLKEDIDDGEEIVHDTTKLFGIGLMISSAILFSIVCVVNRTLKNVHFSVIITWHGIFATSLAIIIIFVQTVIMG
jgi:drug/metabolite transporter (DMT)-like permease